MHKTIAKFQICVFCSNCAALRYARHVVVAICENIMMSMTIMMILIAMTIMLTITAKSVRPREETQRLTPDWATRV